MLFGSNATLYTLSSPACSHDPERNRLAIVVVPEQGVSATPSMLEEGAFGPRCHSFLYRILHSILYNSIYIYYMLL